MTEHDWEKIVVSKYNATFNVFCVLSLKFGGKSPKIGGVWTPRTLAVWMYEFWYLVLG